MQTINVQLETIAILDAIKGHLIDKKDDIIIISVEVSRIFAFHCKTFKNQINFFKLKINLFFICYLRALRR